jgi:trigger factor
MPLQTSVEPLEGNKVRLHVAVPAADFEQAIDAAFRKLAREVKIPGFRPGKAPRRLLEARLGTEVARDQALRDSLPDYYAEAVVAEAIDAIAAPEIDITAGEEAGDVEFDAVVEVRPIVELDAYTGLRVEIPNPAVADDTVQAQVDALRERFADLEESRAPLAEGDYAEIDIKGYVHDTSIEGLTATDYLYEVGSGLLVPELDRELTGKRVGDILKFNAVLPERFGERAGQEVAFQVLVKETKRKVLPAVTDDWVSEVSEFDTVDALTADIRKRLELYARVQAQLLVRDRLLDALADLVTIDVPDTLVNQEMQDRLQDLARRLQQQGATIAEYLAASGEDQAAFLERLRGGAVRAVRADLALRAVIAAEQIAATDDELEAEVHRLAESMEQEPATLRKDLERRGVLEAVRSEVARRNAVQFLVDHAAVVDESGNPVELDLPSASGETTGEGGGAALDLGDDGHDHQDHQDAEPHEADEAAELEEEPPE